MKYGIITDIHSNILALQIVLKKFEELKVDKIICCGDIIGIGPCPEEVVQELINLNDKFIGVRGNHENYLLVGLPKEVHDDKRGMSENEINCHLWNQSRLSSSSKDFLATLPYETTIEESGKKICILHYPMNKEKEYKQHIKFPTIDECKKLFEDYDADIYLYGHTHTKSIVKENNKLYINVGSLGCPMSESTTNFGILTINNDKVYYAKPQHNKNIINDEVKSNYSSSSVSSNNINNISNSSIKTMINMLGGREKFEDIKIKKYNISSKSSTNSINEPKYVIKNYSYVNTNNNLKNKTNNNKQLSLLFKQKIENSKIDEEIILPPEEIEVETLVITNPIKIRGQTDSAL